MSASSWRISFVSAEMPGDNRFAGVAGSDLRPKRRCQLGATSIWEQAGQPASGVGPGMTAYETLARAAVIRRRAW